VIAVYLLLLLPTVAHHGIGWDEQTDYGVALAYLQQPGGWLVGSDIDPINVRLPMATSAAVFALLGRPSLITARLVSCALGVATLIAVFVFCRRELDDRKAVVACSILATSPYYLAYTKAAFTEGDVFVTCALAWLLVCLAGLRRERSLGWGALTGVVLGAAMASKISGIAAVPVVLVSVMWPAKDEADSAEALPPRAWTAIAGLLAALYVGVFGGWELGRALSAERSVGFLAGHAAFVVALWLAVLAMAARHRDARLGRGRLASLVLLLGGLSFFVLPPLHTTNPDIFRNLIGAFLFSNFASPASFAFEAAALHFAVIALKPSPLIGLAMWLGLALACFRVRARPELRIPLLLTICYLLFLLRLPWAQPFYMLPAFPILAILLADCSVECFDRRRTAATLLATVALVFLGADLVRSHPDFHLNGYQWVGARIWGGRPTLGARSLVPVPPDGAEQALRWVNQHAQPGDTVVTFVRPWHIRDAVLQQQAFRVVDGLEEPAAISGADWVVTTLGAEINHGYGAENPSEVFAIPYDAEILRRDFTRVFSVNRAFDLEVAGVWQRRPQPQRTPVPPIPQ
jgi:hypothetical protein